MTDEPVDIEGTLGEQAEPSARLDQELVPYETRAERNPNAPMPEDELMTGYKPSADERRMAFELLMIEGMTIRRAARALDISDKTFRKAFSRAMGEAAAIRSRMDPGTNFTPSMRQRADVSSYLAAGLSTEIICGIMFRGQMTVSRFVELFAHEVGMGKNWLKGVAIKTIGRVMLEGNDREALNAAKFVAKQKGLGNMRDTTRYDHEAPADAAMPTTKLELEHAKDELIDGLVRDHGLEPAIAEVVAKALMAKRTGAPGDQIH